MNKAKNFPQVEKRKTRTYLVTVDEQKYLDGNFIDNYYRKKKKNKIEYGIINDPSPLTKIKFEIPGEQASLKETSQKILEKINLPNKAKIKRKCNENGVDKISMQTSILENSQIASENEKKIIVDPADPKNQNLEAQYQINTQSNDLTKPVKKVSKRYQELLQNSLLIFDKPKKKTFSVIKDSDVQLLNEAHKLLGGFEAKLVKDLKLDPKELAFNLKFSKPDLISRKTPVKIFKQSQKKINPNIHDNLEDLKQENIIFSDFLSKIPQNILTEDLFSIYREVVSIRFIGKKRQPDFSIFQKEDDSRKYPNFIFEFPHIEKALITKESLKKNFLDKNMELLLKNKISVLRDPLHQSNKHFCFGEFLPNAYEKSIRRDYANSLDFIQQFNEDYKPIQMQKENEKLFQSDNTSVCTEFSGKNSQSNAMNNPNSTTKTHFIKKKQSAVNIKRQCGVSYVVASESKQKDVSEKYAPLGHLVYQGTYSIPLISQEVIIEKISLLIEKELMDQPLLVTYFETQEEDEMKDYLLFKEKRHKIAKNIFIIQSLDDIWKFSKDKHFLCIHLLTDEVQGIRNYTMKELESLTNKSLLSKSDVQIGIIFRKATSGIKSVLKLYKNGGLDLNRHATTLKLANITPLDTIDETIDKLSGTNMSTLSMRIELYVKENQWKESNYFTKQFLFSFISLVEERITSLILNWNENRLLVHLLAKENEIFNSKTLIYLKKPKSKVKKIQLENDKFLEEDKNNLNLFSNTSGEKVVKQNLIVNLDRKNLIYFENKLLEDTCTINSLLEKGIIINFTQEEFPLHSFFTINYSNSPLPMYIISTRDCFVFDLNVKEEIINYENKQIIKKEFFFDENNIPSNFHKFKTGKDDLRVGVVTYENFFSNEELLEIEENVEKTEELSLKEAFLPETAQKTLSGEKLKRTKFFFGSRYMWTKKQLAEPNSYVAAGIRRDVSPAPYWMKEKIESPLVEADIIKKDFINSFALNVYHDGTEGLGQHFDDAVRFKQPIYTLRLFSDCRLSFGSQLYGFCNGAFTIPLPRGCVCVMEENSYASNGVKHCIRPCDMTGKSSALILRQMHPNMVQEADKYDFQIDFPSWFSTLSINENSIPYATQKSKEADFLLKLQDSEKKQNHNQINENITNIESIVSGLMNDMLLSIDMLGETCQSFLAPKSKKRKSDY